MSRDRWRSLLGAAVMPLLAFVTLVAWMYASPIASAPDDDFHLVSAWCAAGEQCAPGAGSTTRVVPAGLVESRCFAFDNEVSAACQDEVWGHADAPVETTRGNFRGEYPPVYYAVMGLFAGPDVQVSALVMRLATILVALGLTVATAVLLPVRHRTALLWAWLIGSVPLGIFLLTSTNPSSWAAIGVLTSAFALLGWFETRGARGWWLGGLFAVSVLVAAGARSDAALYTGLGMLGAIVLTFRPTRDWWLRAILPVVMGLVALAFYFGTAQTGSTGFSEGGGGGQGGEALSGFGLLMYNALNVPFVWAGNFGLQWGLGWLDTTMPWLVPTATIGAFFIAIGAGLARKDARTLVVAAIVALALWILPVYVLQAGGHRVLEGVQPRYLLPLLLLLAGYLMLARPGPPVVLGRAPAWAVAGALALANFVALHINLRRYVTGVDVQGLNLDAGAEWWWSGLPIGPTAVWLLGSSAFAALVFLLVPRLADGRPLALGSTARMRESTA